MHINLCLSSSTRLNAGLREPSRATPHVELCPACSLRLTQPHSSTPGPGSEDGMITNKLSPCPSGVLLAPPEAMTHPRGVEPQQHSSWKPLLRKRRGSLCSRMGEGGGQPAHTFNMTSLHPCSQTRSQETYTHIQAQTQTHTHTRTSLIAFSGANTNSVLRD